MQQHPLIRGAIEPANAVRNFESLLPCGEWHAQEFTGPTN